MLKKWKFNGNKRKSFLEKEEEEGKKWTKCNQYLKSFPISQLTASRQHIGNVTKQIEMNEIENNMHKYRRDEKKMRKKKKTIQEEVQTKQIKK